MQNTQTKYESQELTEEVMKAISKQLRKDKLPQDEYQSVWNKRLHAILMELVNHFDDGNDVIIQAKLADQVTRMFEKMMDTVAAAGTRKKWERRDAVLADVGIEITQNKIDDIDNDIDRLRQQYWILNQAFKTCRYTTRPTVISQCGVNFGQYTTLKDLPKVKRMQAKKGQITVETYEAHKNDFWEFARESGLVEMPADTSYAE